MHRRVFFFSPGAILELHSTFPARGHRVHRVLRKRARGNCGYQRYPDHHSGGLANILCIFCRRGKRMIKATTARLFIDTSGTLTNSCGQPCYFFSLISDGVCLNGRYRVLRKISIFPSRILFPSRADFSLIFNMRTKSDEKMYNINETYIKF